MSQSLLADALAAGQSIVTPNNRLARDVVARFDAASRAAGKLTWASAQALPWTMWLERLLLAALAARASTGWSLLDASAARELWHTLVVADRRPLLNSRGAARHAADAWTLFHGWRDGDEALTRVASGGGDDARLFAGWADRYRRRLGALHAFDHAQLPDVLATRADPSWTRSLGGFALYGFLRLTPQQQRLVDALRGAGVAIDEVPAARAGSAFRRTSCATSSLEVAQALGFARSRLEADPRASIAIVVVDLAQRRDEVVALAEEILCPDRLLSLASDSPRPYGVSLGEPLASVPLVVSALDLVAMATGTVAATVAASAVRGPFLPDAATRWTERAAVERLWRREARREVAWPDILAALRQSDPALHRRWSALVVPARTARLPREWARAWSDWLVAAGWPGTSALSSAQWQAREAWSNALGKFAALGAVTGTLKPAEALETLRAQLAETLFQPQSPAAPIQILGVLEAAGLSFDHAWLAGFDAQRWPPAPSPNPFLPLGWQRARGVIGAQAETTLSHAQALTVSLAGLAREVVVSHADTIDDAPSSISPLFEHWPRVPVESLPHVERFSAAMMSTALERLIDETGPPIAQGATVRGGAQLFESQSACPFQAFARYRLRAEAWDAFPEGLSAKERGIVLHGMLNAFWDDVRDHATLLGLDAANLATRIAAAVERGKMQLTAARWQTLPPAVASAETRRLAATLGAWVDEGERIRPPFRVRKHEQAVECEVGGIAVRVRIDRIDELGSGGLAVADYKSGRVIGPARWFGERPEGVQLALYAQAVDQLDDQPLRALAYAQLKAGEIAVSGIAEADGLWPGLEVAGSTARVPVASWDDARAKMRDGIGALAREIRDGVAPVAPRSGATCQYCDLKPLCRIRVLDDRGDAEAPDA